MVMKVEPIYKALRALKLKNGLSSELDGNLKFVNKKNQITNYKLPITKTILLSAKGKKWNQQMAKKYSKLDNIILICGRYEGVDERVKKFVDEEISIGDYVLTGGEIPAMAIVDSIARLLPGVLGNIESAKQESHSDPGVLEYPQYTRPEIFTAPLPAPHSEARAGIKGVGGIKKYKAPKVLLSGNHQNIKEWRKKHSKIIDKK